ncbi:MAG: SMP-30/gluconolactonase/LRE family protein [Myxococcota bacterium]
MISARTSLVPTGLLALVVAAGCSSSSNNGGGQGGSNPSGGSANGGSASGGTSNTQGGSSNGGSTTSNGGSTGNGGSSNGGTASGGSNSTGGSTNSGGSSNGGSNSSGGSSNGGSSNGGSANGGSSQGGSAQGGSSQGGSAQGGSKSTGYVCPTVQAGTNPLPSNATATPVTGAPPADSFNNNNNDFKILEGPVWFQDALYFSEIKNGQAPPPARVLKVTSSGTVSIAIPPENAGTNGLAIDNTGKLIGANHTQGAIVRLDPTGATAAVPIVGTYMNQRFNSPNDLTVRADGNIYFTDPQHQAGSMRMNQRVYRIAPNGTTATVVQDNANGPNGITLSLDGNTLFVSHGPDSGGVDKYPLNADGSIGTPMTQLTSTFSSDGMGIDCLGNLYLSQQNKIVVISSSTGQKVGEIAVNDVQQATNVAFGGPEHKTLYITSLGNNAKLLKIELNVPGMPY